MDLGHIIHATGRFFPWHRAYIHTIESAMKQHCNYQGFSPYWNWSMDASDFYSASIFADPDPESGLGGWGNPGTGAHVADGAFAGFAVSYPYQHTLTRNFTLRPYQDYPDAEQWHIIRDKMANVSFTPEAMEETIDGWVGDYRGFQFAIEGVQMVDKVWNDWQVRHPDNLNAFSGGSIYAEEFDDYDMFPVGLPPDLNRTDYLPSNGLFFDNIRIADVLSTTSGYLCYIYE
ncbi:hypothetical protein C0991_011911 [Blastosporella zonata]|nr:hypothetical protein C0991_011911 [Blastosporella zonata]